MDPHSRRAQYNQRPPKAGPELQNLRQVGIEPKTVAVLEAFRKTSSENLSPTSSLSRASSMSLSTALPKAREKDKSREHNTGSPKSPSIEREVSLTNRPIASNSRVRREEKYKRNMYLAFVDNALSQKAQGVSENYDDLVRQFLPVRQQSQDSQNRMQSQSSAGPSTPPHIQSQQLRGCLGALQHVVSKLDRSHSSLVDAVISMPWAVRDSALAQAYVAFVGVLISARPEYVGKVLEVTVQGLTYQSARKALDAAGAEQSITRRTVYSRVHGLLMHLYEIIPTLPTPLFPFLARAFPHRRERLAEHVAYVHNLLRVAEYMPELWERILGLVVDRAIQIDVEIQVEIEELEAIGVGEEAEEMFQLDIFDTLVGQEGDEPDSDDEDDEDDGALSDISSEAGSVDDEKEGNEEEPRNVKHIQDMVVKLDSVLEVVFKHLDKLRKDVTASSPNSRSRSPSLSSFPASTDGSDALSPPTSDTLNHAILQRQALTESHFHALLAIFKRTILRTFKSRYTQFLLFWYSSLDDAFRDCFLGALVAAALLEPSQPVVTRAAAASYLASYVSRAAFVGQEETQNVVRMLCDFLAAHLETFDKLAHTPDALIQQQQSADHAVFYAVAQAMFLIFCFRWRDLQDELKDEPEEYGGATGANLTHRIWFPPLTVMQRVVSSPLNPLKVCSSNVVQQFARVAQRVGFVYCFSIIEANRRAEYAADSKRVAGIHATAAATFDAELTTFFPFDPFRLPRSCVFIENIYREWTSVALDESDDEDEDESDEEDDGLGGSISSHQSYEDLHMHGPSSLADGGASLGASFGGMSISPARPVEVAVQ